MLLSRTNSYNKTEDVIWSQSTRRQTQKQKQGVVQVSRPYLCALLLAAEHNKAVPHCSEGNSVYMQLLDPAWKKPQKQRRLEQQQFIDKGEWAEVEEKEEKKPKQARRRRPTKAAVEVDGTDSSSESAASEASASSSSSTSSSSSSSASTSSGGGSGGDGIVHKAVAKPKGKAKAQQSDVIQRRSDTRIPFGKHWITPRYCRDSGNITGYFMRCFCDGHQEDGRCSRELSISQSGGDAQMTLNILCAWILFGQTCQSRTDHRKCFNMVREIAAQGMLPSQDVLLAQLQQDEASVIDISECDKVTLEDAPAVPARCGMRLKRKQPNPCGPQGDIPEDISSQASVMMSDGSLPFSTSEQRERNRMSAGTEYGVPVVYKPFLLHGYIHPNLPAPRNMSWKCSPGKWWLSFVRGG